MSGARRGCFSPRKITGFQRPGAAAELRSGWDCMVETAMCALNDACMRNRRWNTPREGGYRSCSSWRGSVDSFTTGRNSDVRLCRHFQIWLLSPFNFIFTFWSFFLNQKSVILRRTTVDHLEKGRKSSRVQVDSPGRSQRLSISFQYQILSVCTKSSDEWQPS